MEESNYFTVGTNYDLIDTVEEIFKGYLVNIKDIVDSLQKLSINTKQALMEQWNLNREIILNILPNLILKKNWRVLWIHL